MRSAADAIKGPRLLTESASSTASLIDGALCSEEVSTIDREISEEATGGWLSEVSMGERLYETMSPGVSVDIANNHDCLHRIIYLNHFAAHCEFYSQGQSSDQQRTLLPVPRQRSASFNDLHALHK